MKATLNPVKSTQNPTKKVPLVIMIMSLLLASCDMVEIRELTEKQKQEQEAKWAERELKRLEKLDEGSKALHAISEETNKIITQGKEESGQALEKQQQTMLKNLEQEKPKEKEQKPPKTQTPSAMDKIMEENISKMLETTRKAIETIREQGQGELLEKMFKKETPSKSD